MLSRPAPLYSTGLSTDAFGQVELQVFDVLEPLEAAWKQLESEGIASIYQQFEWINLWIKNVAGHARMKPRLVLGSNGGKPLFILPMGLRQRGPFTIATWLGDSHSNFHMGLYTKEFVEGINADDMRRIIDCAAENIGFADVLEFCCQPLHWKGYKNPISLLQHQEAHNHAYALDLSGGFDAAISSKNKTRKLKKHRWQQNKLKQVGGARLRIASSPEEVNAFLDVSFEQMGHRFDRAGIWNSFKDEGVDPFVRELAIASLNQPCPTLMVYGLEIDGRIRATFAGGICNNQFSGCFISLANDEYSTLSLGELIIYLVIEDCCERGIEFFDLGRGEERYKTSWCDVTINMFDTNLALTRRAIAFSAYEGVKRSTKRLVRNNHVLWGLAKKIRARFYGRI